MTTLLAWITATLPIMTIIVWIACQGELYLERMTSQRLLVVWLLLAIAVSI